MTNEFDKDKFNSVNWESLDFDEVLDILSSSKNGITSKQAEEILKNFGENKLPEQKKDSKIKKFLMQFNNALIYVLIGAAILTAILGHWLDTWVILGVVIINSLIGYIQEDKAEKALESIKHLLSLKSSVIRDGERKEIPATELVPGDIVLLSSGDKIPADLRLTYSNNFKVEEASLTGESEAVKKDTAPVKDGTVLGERFSMAYTGTTVRQGSARGVVIATGSDTELGKINKMLSDTVSVSTPLIRKINKFGKGLSVAIIIFALAVFAFGFFIANYSIADISIAVIGLAVAAIPEGLPAILTVTLAIGVQKMAKRNSIIRKLPSVETLGSVTVICSDKTGTLTKNEMTVVSVYTKEGKFDIEGAGYKPEGNILKDGGKINPKDFSALYRLLMSAYLCNDSQVSNESGQWTIQGTPTEGALLALAKKAGFENFDGKRLHAIPFESEHKYMATLNLVDEKKYVFVNGAPERLLARSSKQLDFEGNPEELDESFWNTQVEKGALEGQRMLGCAFYIRDDKTEKIEHDDLDGNLIFLGVCGLIDPPRPEAIEAIKLAKKSGIRIKMITGDHMLTAKTIGNQMGIGDGVTALNGAELEDMTDEDMQKEVVNCDIFARTSPEHKLRLVTALQANGEICAMTGDGVNDAPALKKADIGIAMGIKGTEVTKDSAAMVLADDNFASIISAVEEGRTIYDNLRKTLLFMLPTNGAEALVVVAAILLGTTLPISPVQILWVNMVTAITLGISLAFEPMESDTMERPPRDPKQSIFGAYFTFRILFVSALIGGATLYLFSLLEGNPLYSSEAAGTIAVNTIVAGELFYLFNCRKIRKPALGKGFFSNKVALLTAGLLVVLQLTFVYAPFMNKLFGTEALGPLYWLYSIVVGLGVFVIVELEKWITGKVKGFK